MRFRAHAGYSAALVSLVLVAASVASLSCGTFLVTGSRVQATTTSTQSSVACSSSIVITSDKSSYAVGERVKLSGFLTGAYCGFYCPQGATCDIAIYVVLKVEDPLGRVVYSNNLSYFDPGSNFSFSDVFVLAQNSIDGTYTASAKVGDRVSSTTSFLVRLATIPSEPQFALIPLVAASLVAVAVSGVLTYRTLVRKRQRKAAVIWRDCAIRKCSYYIPDKPVGVGI